MTNISFPEIALGRYALALLRKEEAVLARVYHSRGRSCPGVFNRKGVFRGKGEQALMTSLFIEWNQFRRES
jgi:hypothetical protein